MDEELAWETLDAETAYACPGFDVVREDVRFPDGTKGAFDYVQHGESVIVLPFTADGDVVVIEEWRQPVRRINYGLPAGTMEDEDDDPTVAAARELREETGYEADTFDHLYTGEPANGNTDYVFHYYVARGCEAAADQNLDHNESIRVDTADFDSLVQSVRDGTLRDSRSAVGIMYYALFER